MVMASDISACKSIMPPVGKGSNRKAKSASGRQNVGLQVDHATGKQSVESYSKELFHLFGCVLHRLNDIVVSGAAAQVA